MASADPIASRAAIVSLATDLRPPRAVGPDAILRAAAEVGAGGVHAAGGCDLELLAPVVAGAARLGLEVASATLPMPERALTHGRRLPRLVSSAPDERAAAISLAERGLMGLGGGARAVLLDFGAIELATPFSTVARAFARRALDEDEGDLGARQLAAARDERRARSGQVLDACRWALEALVRAGERVGAVMVLPVAATPWEAPSPREVTELLALFAGAPIGPAWDPGRLSVLGALGLPIADERLAGLAAGAVLDLENDAVGLRAGYLPGLGERDPRVAEHRPEASPAVVIRGDADATHDEIARAVASIGDRR